MKKIFIKTNNSNPHFIGSWSIEPSSICEELINYFELNIAKQTKGKIVGGVNQNIKDSIDIVIKPNEIILPGNEVFKSYFEKLFECYKDYLNEWSFLKDFLQELEIGSFNLQRYLPGQHFKKIHTDLDVLFSFYNNESITITGTNGKSTTSKLLHDALIDQKRDSRLIGNIGNPALSEKNITKKTIFVVEALSLIHI